ncbi:hypothetical protein K9L63_03600 [Candidatus Gracilibacteria bacterium]|nr:hypothetical protein [Candidatus Gracilibacteria bacterium]
MKHRRVVLFVFVLVLILLFSAANAQEGSAMDSVIISEVDIWEFGAYHRTYERYVRLGPYAFGGYLLMVAQSVKGSEELSPHFEASLLAEKEILEKGIPFYEKNQAEIDSALEVLALFEEEHKWVLRSRMIAEFSSFHHESYS